MLFELLYLTSQGKRPTAKELDRTFEQIENLAPPRRQGDEVHIVYRNVDTSVECRFVRYPPEHDDEIGLAFETEVPRPSFFALEVLPIAILVARELRLSMDLLTDQGSVFVEKPTIEELLSHWFDRNREAAQAGKAIYQGRSEDLEAMWEFMLLRGDLARRYSRRGVNVPEVKLLVEKKTKKVGRYIEWDAAGPVAIGDIDWIKLVNPPDPLKDGSIYDAEEFFEATKPLVRAVPQPVYHHLCDKQSVTRELADAISDLKRRTDRSFGEIGFDQVIDC
ncbi:MAG: hypothetical protein KC910_07225 [Candidatus Eremiobacteraeota bacterium]|nr:hypothetical protein [Candidatus Eremiobacteraeota bacterium]